MIGFVFEAENKNTKKRVALKRIEKTSNSLSREYEILQIIQGCENVVKM
jgi:glycogen synthase kinase 3 beta